MTFEELAIQGRTSIPKSMVENISAHWIQLRKESIRQSLSDFEHEPHRLETIARIHGIRFINDSKSTNVNSTWYALECINEPIIWIAGSGNQNTNYEKLYEIVHKKVKAIVCHGTNTTDFTKGFSKCVEQVFEAKTTEEAVLLAYSLGKKGDTVLLSPACASFELFENYEDRGNQFRKAVKNL